MKRRFFSALLGSAPAAIAMPIVTPVQPQYPPPPFGMTTGLINECQRHIPSPLELLERKKRQQYVAAREAAHKTLYMRHRINTGTELNHNIAALRSVSPQHKAHMMEAWRIQVEEEQKTWLDKLAESFGFNREEEGGGQVLEASSGRRY
jgi:hypothetical protein